jgi:hypothetical protein
MWAADERLHVGVLCRESHSICCCRIEVIRPPEKLLVIEISLDIPEDLHGKDWTIHIGCWLVVESTLVERWRVWGKERVASQSRRSL